MACRGWVSWARRARRFVSRRTLIRPGFVDALPAVIHYIAFRIVRGPRGNVAHPSIELRQPLLIALVFRLDLPGGVELGLHGFADKSGHVFPRGRRAVAEPGFEGWG
jgi:hypothetical protein